MPVKIRNVEYSSLYSLLIYNAKQHPGRIGLIDGNIKVSYGELNRLVDQFSGVLASFGIGPGDNVALYLPNSIEMVVAYFAIWRLGAVAVPINYMWKDEVKFVLKDSQTKLVLTSSDKFVAMEGMRAEVKAVRHVVDVSSVLEKAKVYPIPSPALIKEHQCAVIIYTSGTTGRPKGAMLSHYNILSNLSSCCWAIDFSYRDSIPCLLPLFHSFALTVCLLTPMVVGAKVFFVDPSIGPRRAFRQMVRYKATILVGIPALFSLMAETRIPDWLPMWIWKLVFPIRVAISGSSALPKDVLKRFQEKYKIPLLEGYGLTEASPVVSLNPINAVRPGSVGLPIKDVEVKIVDEKGMECPVGRVGEILVKGPNVMLGYYRRLIETRNALRNGWLYTGDLGHKDQDGYLYIVGRKKEMIIVRGMNVYPREIENTLLELPGVKECAVVGVKHKTKGEVPYAFVVLKKGWDIQPKEMIAYLRSKLADYKVPQRVIIIDNLPRNSLRKVQKQKLIAMLSEGRTKNLVG